MIWIVLGNQKLTKIIIPDSVKEISKNCFLKCTNLKEVNIPTSVTKLGEFCFADCSSLTKINILESNESINSVKEIGAECFGKCGNLKEINIPTSINKINDCWFDACGLTKIDILESNESINSIKEIGDGCFSSCYI